MYIIRSQPIPLSVSAQESKLLISLHCRSFLLIGCDDFAHIFVTVEPLFHLVRGPRIFHLCSTTVVVVVGMFPLFLQKGHQLHAAGLSILPLPLSPLPPLPPPSSLPPRIENKRKKWGFHRPASGGRKESLFRMHIKVLFFYVCVASYPPRFCFYQIWNFIVPSKKRPFRHSILLCTVQYVHSSKMQKGQHFGQDKEEEGKSCTSTYVGSRRESQPEKTQRTRKKKLEQESPPPKKKLQVFFPCAFVLLQQ